MAKGDESVWTDISGFIKDIQPISPEEVGELEGSFDPLCEPITITGVWDPKLMLVCPRCGANFEWPHTTLWPVITLDGSDLSIPVCETCGITLAAACKD